ncbi:hypothetical protein BGZ50_005725 [Haplosporangium sp. Z 11]|nr:hypothetical protein BGZ50_005725 [Haplosporangium sp. Z 11]
MGSMHNLNLQIFERLIRNVTRVVCLDSDLSIEEVDILRRLHSDVHIINNTFQQQKDDKVRMLDSKWRLIAEAQQLLRAHKRLWTSSTMSAACTEALHAVFEKPGFRDVCVIKNTSENMKWDVETNTSIIMRNLDYFIHTPTISVGVDYNI